MVRIVVLSCFALSVAACGARSELRHPRLDAAVDTPTVDVRDAAPILRASVLAAGARHACASLADGTTRCWGANDVGQLGDATTTDSARPVHARLPDGAARLAAGDNHACGQGPGGGVFCWGANESGQLGDGTIESRSEPVRVLVAGVTEMSLGRAHTLFRIEDGTARSFGANTACQLGDPSRTGNDPMPAPVPGFNDLTAIGAGGDFSCSVQRTGSLGCVGTLDPGAPTWCVPIDVGGVDGVAEIAVGSSHACVRTNAGVVLCHGANDFGQLGDGGRARRDQWMPVTLRARAIGIAAGAGHSCALLEGGSIVCWGSNASGELAVPGGMDQLLPVDVAIGGAATAIALGTSFSCAIREDGAVICWGLNARGQLGDGTTVTRETPMPVVF